MEGDARGDRRSRRIQTTIDRVGVGSHPVDWQAGSEKGRLLWGRDRGKKIKGNGPGCFYV